MTGDPASRYQGSLPIPCDRITPCPYHHKGRSRNHHFSLCCHTFCTVSFLLIPALIHLLSVLCKAYPSSARFCRPRTALPPIGDLLLSFLRDLRQTATAWHLVDNRVNGRRSSRRALKLA